MELNFKTSLKNVTTPIIYPGAVVSILLVTWHQVWEYRCSIENVKHMTVDRWTGN